MWQSRVEIEGYSVEIRDGITFNFYMGLPHILATLEN